MYARCLEHLATRADQATREDRGGLDDDWTYFEAVDSFNLDVVKVLGSKALNRLGDKTQVFVGRENPHTRSRSRHTHDVAGVAVVIGSVTHLNCDLIMAGALGHDIGHLPFGHHGETALSKITGKVIEHATVGVVIARRVERQARGLNLTTQTLQAILHHSSGAGSVNSTHGIPEEAAAVKWADKIAYVFADVNDFARCLQDSEPSLVEEIERHADLFGHNERGRIAHCVDELVRESAEVGHISFSGSECAQQFVQFKGWLYDNAYFPTQGARIVLIDGLRHAYDLLGTCPEFGECDKSLLLALLTDDEARHLMDLALDSRKLSIKQIPNFGIVEIYQHLRGVRIDLTDPWA
jgi:dGTP triphosphohydrolase